MFFFSFLTSAYRRGGKLFQTDKKTPEMTSVFRHFGACCTCRSWSPSQHTTLKNSVWKSTVCYPLVNEDQKNSRRLELSIFKKHPAQKVGTRSRQCRPKLLGRSAFPGARNPRICSIWRFGNFFSNVSGVSRSFPREPPNRPQQQPQPSRVL